jgi:hypothetical protein
MRVRSFQAADLVLLTAPAGPGLQAGQAYLAPGLTPALGSSLVHAGPAFTVATDDGRPIGCIGLVEQWEGRALAWAVLAGDAGRVLVGITRAVRRFLDLGRYRRIEAAVPVGFAAGHRWARLLGFTLEAPVMRSWSAGRDFALYALIAPENRAEPGAGG